MDDKINDLKQLIECLAEDSPLREELNKVLEAATTGQTEPSATEPSETMDENHSENTIEEETQQDNKPEDEKRDDDEQYDESTFDRLKDNMENLLKDNEFITAAAGFVLGAVVVGLGATLVAAMKK